MELFLLSGDFGESPSPNDYWRPKNFPSLLDAKFHGSDGQKDTVPLDVPNTFLCFYKGQLPDSIEAGSPSASRTNRKYKQRSYRLDLAYRGSAFCGWQTQDKQNRDTNLRPAVQQLVEAALGGRDVRGAGRTDAGVHAVGQVARVRCDINIPLEQVRQQLHEASIRNGHWKCRRIVPVSQSFHPNFGATSRSYVYLIDADEVLERAFGDLEGLTFRLNALLAPLEGQELSYSALSYGRLKTKTSNCTLKHARARRLELAKQPVLAIELEGDRFLRRMVRILVSTSLKFAARSNGFDSQALLKLVQTRDRRRAAFPAPPHGLIFVSASFDDSGS